MRDRAESSVARSFADGRTNPERVVAHSEAIHMSKKSPTRRLAFPHPLALRLERSGLIHRRKRGKNRIAGDSGVSFAELKSRDDNLLHFRHVPPGCGGLLRSVPALASIHVPAHQSHHLCGGAKSPAATDGAVGIAERSSNRRWGSWPQGHRPQWRRENRRRRHRENHAIDRARLSGSDPFAED
jgi:hypothetical protein